MGSRARFALAMPMCMAVASALALLAAAAPVSAQARVTTEVDTTLVTVGDRITLAVAVEHPAGSSVQWPDSLDLSPFEVVDAAVGPARSVGEGLVSTAMLSLTVFDLGELEIPSFPVEIVSATGDVEVLETDRFGIEVVTVGMDDTGDIRGIRGPLALPVGVVRVAGGLLLLLLAAAVAYLLYRRLYSTGASEEGPQRGLPPRPAHEIALEALAELEASPLLGSGRVKEFHIAVSDILRTYVERRFRVDALEMTTFEIVRGLDTAGVDPELRDDLRRFLSACDLVKFAKVRPSEATSMETLRLGRSVVERSIPAVPIPDVDVEAAESGLADGSPEDEDGVELVGSAPEMGAAPNVTDPSEPGA